MKQIKKNIMNQGTVFSCKIKMDRVDLHVVSVQTSDLSGKMMIPDKLIQTQRIMYFNIDFHAYMSVLSNII